MARPRNKYADYLVYIGARLFAMVVHVFGWEANYRTAREMRKNKDQPKAVKEEPVEPEPPRSDEGATAD